MLTFRFFVLWRKKHTQRNHSLLDFLSFAVKTIRNSTSQYSSCRKLTLTLLSISFSSLFFCFINDSATLILKLWYYLCLPCPVFLFIPNPSPSLLLAFILLLYFRALFIWIWIFSLFSASNLEYMVFERSALFLGQPDLDSDSVTSTP